MITSNGTERDATVIPMEQSVTERNVIPVEHGVMERNVLFYENWGNKLPHTSELYRELYRGYDCTGTYYVGTS